MLAFQQASWLCSICYDEVPGSKCVRLPCQHHYCAACMSQHCATQLEEGAVHNIRCPQPDCRQQLQPYALQQLLSTEQFERWEELLLRRTLDRMDDGKPQGGCGGLEVARLPCSCPFGQGAARLAELAAPAGNAPRHRQLLPKRCAALPPPAVVYCPRCNTPGIEEQGHMSQCQECLFAYCT
jgi:E3 ubiquitin-protein ligase RNF14